MAARATQARGDGDGDEGEDDGGLLGGGLRAMREHPAAFAASAALGVGVNYLSVRRKTAELENNTMMGASCAVGPFSAVSTG